MFLKIFALLAVLLLVVLVLAATRPNTLHIQRSLLIDAPPGKIFACIDDFRNWPRWAPQDKDDSTMVRTFSGPTSGPGAVSEWHSKGSAGQGKMSIVESLPPTRVSVKVDFVKPFSAHNFNDFTLEPAGTYTKVTWAMHGTNLFPMKIMSVFVNMDRMLGKHFEAGLKNLKSIAEN